MPAVSTSVYRCSYKIFHWFLWLLVVFIIACTAIHIVWGDIKPVDRYGNLINEYLPITAVAIILLVPYICYITQFCNKSIIVSISEDVLEITHTNIFGFRKQYTINLAKVIKYEEKCYYAIHNYIYRYLNFYMDGDDKITIPYNPHLEKDARNEILYILSTHNINKSCISW